MVQKTFQMAKEVLPASEDKFGEYYQLVVQTGYAHTSELSD